MFRASRIGTPLETSVPSVRVVRASDVLFDQLAEDRHLEHEHVPADRGRA